MSAPNDLSFLPDDYLVRKAHRRTNVIGGILSVVVVAAIGTAFSLADRSVRALEDQYAALEKQCAEAAVRIEQAEQMQSKERQVVRQAELAASLVEKMPRGNVLASITNMMPQGVSLLDLTLQSSKRSTAPAPAAMTAFEKKKAAIETSKKSSAEPSVFDVTIKLVGIAGTDLEIAQFIRKLSEHEYFRDVNLVVIDELVQDDDRLRKFQIEMMINPFAVVKPVVAEAPKVESATIDIH
jgi:hypothetical protein